MEERMGEIMEANGTRRRFRYGCEEAHSLQTF